MRTIVPRGARLIPEHARRVFTGIMYDVYHWPQKMYDGKEATFEMLKRVDSVKVVAIKDDKLVLVEERQPTHTRAYAMPGGRHDVESETELACAQRELKEETGMIFKSWKLLTVVQPSDEMEWFIYIFLATDFDHQEQRRLDSGEDIIVRHLTYEEVRKIVPSRSSLAALASVLEQAGSVDGLRDLPAYS